MAYDNQDCCSLFRAWPCLHCDAYACFCFIHRPQSSACHEGSTSPVTRCWIQDRVYTIPFTFPSELLCCPGCCSLLLASSKSSGISRIPSSCRWFPVGFSLACFSFGSISTGPSHQAQTLAATVATVSLNFRLRQGHPSVHVTSAQKLQWARSLLGGSLGVGLSRFCLLTDIPLSSRLPRCPVLSLGTAAIKIPLSSTMCLACPSPSWKTWLSPTQTTAFTGIRTCPTNGVHACYTR